MKKILSLLLAVAMCTTVFSSVAFSAGSAAGDAVFTGEAVVFETIVLENGEPATDIRTGDTITVKIVYKSGFEYFNSLNVSMYYDDEVFEVGATSLPNMSYSSINDDLADEVLFVGTSLAPVSLTEGAVVASAEFVVIGEFDIDVDADIGVVFSEYSVTNDKGDGSFWEELGGAENPYESVMLPVSFEDADIVIKTNVVRDTDSSLKSLSYKANGETTEIELTGETTFDVTLPYGTTSVEVFAEKNSAKATDPVITNPVFENREGIATVVVTAENGTSTTYTINFTVEAPDNDSSLKSLTYRANGKESAIELTSETTYNVALPIGTTSVEVFAEKSSSKAEEPVITNAVIENRAGIATVAVTAEDGSSTTYTINFTVLADTDSSLKTLSYKVGDATTAIELTGDTTFNVSLPIGTTSVVVFAEKNSDRANEPVIEDAVIENREGVATVVVTAEDGSSTTYTVNFTVLADTDSSLKTLSYKVGEETTAIELTGETTFDVTLPYGTGAVEVFAEKSSKRAGEPVITNPVFEDREGVATVVVTAEDGSSTTYTINFTIEAPDTDSSLESLSYKANGVTTAIALTEETTYSVDLPIGTASVELFAVKNSAKASDPVITNAVIENRVGTATVIVTAEDGSSTTYTINFTVLADTDSTLKSLSYKVGEEETAIELTGETTFNVELPIGTTSVEVFAEKTSDRASDPVITNATIENRLGVATVVVTAEDGSSTTYTINFTVLADSDSTLKTLSYKVGEETTPLDLTSGITFNITLPYGTEAVEVFAEKSSERAEEPVITNPVFEDRVGASTVVVTAEDGTSTTYTINFTIEAPKTDSSLKALAYRFGNEEQISITLEDGKTDYEVTIPYGSVIPAVIAEADTTATSETTIEENVATVTVTAQDGSQTVYTITFVEEAKTYTLTASARGGAILATYGDKVEENWYQTRTENYVTGTTFTLKAVPEDDTEFLYWLDEGSNRVVSYSESHTFTLGTKKDIVAVFVPKTLDDEAVYLIQFVDKNNKVYTTALSNTDINVPADPYILGYTFGGWTIKGELTEYKAYDTIPAGTFTKATELVAKQTKEETLYTVTVDGAVFGQFRYNDEVTVTSTADNFSYWMRDGKIVSYEKEYTFYMANYDTALVAVCEGEVTKTPVITMAEPTIVAGNQISFIMERSLPEGFAVIEAGILLKEGKPEVINLDNYTHISTSANKAPTGTYAVRKANVATGETWSAVGYLIYTDAEGNVLTMYSDIVRKTLGLEFDFSGENGTEDMGELQ